MPKILLADDDGVVRDALEVFLKRDGHEVLTASDGGKAVDIFRRNPPDLVVLDRDMPVMSGSEVLKKIRTISPGVPVVMLTGHDSREGEARYMRAGATAFLSKNDGLLNALNEIDRLLGVRRRQLPGRAEPAPAAAPGSAVKGKALVLVVDDEPSINAAVSRFLSSCGYDVLRAEDGNSALDLALSRRPAAVLLDINMPGMDGVEVLRELVPRLPGTPFIMLSANTDTEVARACLEMGAADYLAKPPNLGQLERLLKSLLFMGAKG